MPVSRVRKSESPAPDEGHLVVTAQQSRFHELDDSASNDIDIKDLSIAIGKREILQHTRLVLKAGLRYVFVGRNGLGKSTVLKALAERRMPGIAPNVRILLLDQTMIEKSQKQMLVPSTTGKDLTVLENVVASDRVRQRLVEDSASLGGVLQDTSAEPTQIVHVLRKLKLEQAKRELEAARLVAQHRSGARGSKARQVLIQKEEGVQQAEQWYVNVHI